MLTPEDIDAVARRVIELQREQQPATRDVLNVTEAIAFVGKSHLAHPEKAFLRWRKAHGLRPCGNGKEAEANGNHGFHVIPWIGRPGVRGAAWLARSSSTRRMCAASGT